MKGEEKKKIRSPVAAKKASFCSQVSWHRGRPLQGQSVSLVFGESSQAWASGLKKRCKPSLLGGN